MMIGDTLPVTEPIAHLAVPASELKMLRENLCSLTAGNPNQNLQRRINLLFEEIDRHRPLGSDGKHGNLHTPTCGCEDK